MSTIGEEAAKPLDMQPPRSDGGPAFPSVGGPEYVKEPGMTLRDWFAGQALDALVARHRADMPWSEVAPTAYKIADAMLAARGR